MSEDYRSTWTACSLQDDEDYSIACEDTSIDCKDCPIKIKSDADWERDKAEHEAEMQARFGKTTQVSKELRTKSK